MKNHFMRPKVLKSKLLAKSWRVGFLEDTLQYGAAKPTLYARITVPDFALVVAERDEDGKIPLVKQYRHGAGREFWELPAGLIEEREKPGNCVRREFMEEVGYKLLEPRFITRIYPSPARSRQIAYVFSGRVGNRVASRPDNAEALTVRFVSRAMALKRLSEHISATHLLAYLLWCRTYDHKK